MSKPVVFIQHTPGEPMMEHCLAAWQGFAWNNYHVRFFEAGDLLPLDSACPVVGSVEATQQLFQRHGLSVPAPLNIPASLMQFAGRTVAHMSLGDFLDFAKLPAFVKPADTAKLWTGGVVSSKDAKLLFAEFPRDTPVLVSPEIQFETEYRVFVSRQSGIVAMRHYAGDPFEVPCRSTIERMISAYQKDAPRAYSLDIGVVGFSEAQTHIVECNDFWVLGTYGMDPVKYAELLSFRWHEMISNL